MASWRRMQKISAGTLTRASLTPSPRAKPSLSPDGLTWAAVAIPWGRHQGSLNWPFVGWRGCVFKPEIRGRVLRREPEPGRVTGARHPGELRSDNPGWPAAVQGLGPHRKHRSSRALLLSCTMSIGSLLQSTFAYFNIRRPSSRSAAG
jgi:hypothetical protein